MSATKKHNPPAFQLYTKDILASESVSLMTNEQVGWYLFLLCHAWNSDPVGTLPNSLEKLRLLARCYDQAEWDEGHEAVLCNFEDLGERIGNRRLMEQFEGMEAYRKNQSRNGKRGGRPTKATGTRPESDHQAKESSSFSSSSAFSSSQQQHVAGATEQDGGPDQPRRFTVE